MGRVFEGVGPEVDLETAVAGAQRGDEAAFRVVYRAVQPQLLQYVRSLVGPVDAEDVASEAWLQIARDLPNFRGAGDSVRGWAARIARNRALDHIRARARRPVSGAGVDELVQLPDRADTAGEALDAVATDRALAAIAALPREQAEAVLLRVVMGLDSTSAARVLGKRAGSVRMATHRGLRRLAELLEQDAAFRDPAGDADHVGVAFSGSASGPKAG
ncbi:RNA polymerase sigma factor [Actinacidiphila alni]